ncbi:MAG: GyrI-like domain-containing protein [Pseudomonadota bacterium]
MEVHIIDLPPARVACHRHVGPYGPALGAFWRGTVAPWMHSHGLDGRICYGVGLDDPQTTPPEQCRYNACVSVADDFQEDRQVGVTTLPGGRYAVMPFKGPTSGIAQAWQWFFSEWLPASGLQCDDRPCFERFSATPGQGPASGEFSCELCIPVKAQ